MPDEVKPPIIRNVWTGTYRQETGRILKTLITDLARVPTYIDGGQCYPIDDDIIKLSKTILVLKGELELVLAYKFPEMCDISAEDLKKHYGIGP